VAVSEAAGSPPVIRTSVSLPNKSVTEIPTTAATSEAATSEAVVLEVPKTSKVNQSPVLPTSPSSSSSTDTDSDSDLDYIPLSRKYNLTKPIPKAKHTLRTKTTTTKSKLSPKPYKETSVDVYKTIGELSERRIGICNKLPSNHPFQPPVIKPLTMLPPGVPIPSSST